MAASNSLQRTRPPRSPLVAVWPVLLALFFAPSARADWDPVPEADRTATDSAAVPGVDAEILVSEHRLDERGTVVSMGRSMGEDRMETAHFIRAKIYTAKGVQDQGKFRIEFSSDTTVADKKARVVKPDGRSIELKKADFFQTVMAKTKDGESWKQITFVFPGLEPGDVIEYQWTEQREGSLWLQRYYCHEEVPVRLYKFTVGEMQARGSIGWLHCPEPETDTGNGYTVVFRNLPAFEEEEHMVPEREVRGWLYVTKTFPMHPKDKDIWEELNRFWADEFAMGTKPGGAVKKKAEALAAGAANDDEKLRRLYEFCQREIFNTSYRTSAQFQAEIEKHKNGSAYSPAKVLELGRGRWDEVNRLFAGLARGLGFEVREARTAARDNLLNIMVPRGWALLHRECVAVQVGGQWRFFDPGNHLVPYGMVDWRDEEALALVCNSRKLEQVPVPASPATANGVRRTGRFTLDAEGTLEGDVEESFLGHTAIRRKKAAWSEANEDVNRKFIEEVTRRLPTAEVSALEWTNLSAVDLPLVAKYHVRVPGYAEQAGARLVFVPGFFTAGAPALFTAPERKNPIMFNFGWNERDEVEIVLPEGWGLDRGSAPKPVGEIAGPFGSTYKLQYNGKTRTFGYQREFALGANGVHLFRAESYRVLKALFEELHKSDTHSILLKPKAATAAAPTQP